MSLTQWFWIGCFVLFGLWLIIMMKSSNADNDLAKKEGLNIEKGFLCENYAVIWVDVSQRKLLLNDRKTRKVITTGDILRVAKAGCEITISTKDPLNPTFRFQFRTELMAQECLDCFRALTHSR